MLLLELAVQGVRGCSASARAALKPGYTLVKGPGAPVPPLASLLAAVLYPDARGGDQVFLAPGLKTGRAGVSLQGEGGVTFRLVRELGGSGALHRLNPGTKAFEVVTQDANEIVSTLRAQASLPTRTAFEQLYLLTAGQFPSRRPRRAVKKTETISAAREFEDLSPEVIADYQARIPILEKELKEAKVLGELQFKQDGLQGELYAAESKLKAHEDAKEKVRAARAQLDAAPSAEKLGLPADIVAQLKRHELEIKKRNEALKKLNEERDGTHVLDTGPTTVAPLYQDTNFLAAMGAGAALTLAGGFLEGYARFVAIAAVASWSFAAMRALAWVEELQFAAKESGRFELHSNREKKLVDERALATAQLKAAFSKAEVESMEEFEALLERGPRAQQALAEAEVVLAELEADPEFVAVSAKSGELRAELDKIQAQFQAAAGGYFRHANEVEKELAGIKEKVRRAKGGAPAAPQVVSASDSGQGTLEDPGPALLAAAAEVMQADVARASVEFKDRASQYLAALSDKKWQSVELTPEGRAILINASGRTPLAEATPKDADLCYLSLRLAVVEKLGQKVKLPLVIEDCFADVVDAVRFPLVNRMLKHLGSVSQVLHVSGAGQNAFQADALVTV